MPVKWRIFLTPTAAAMLAEINDRRVREKVVATIDRLTEDPEKQGKALVGELSGFRTIRSVSQRYRIIYRIQGDAIVVAVVAVGLRRAGARDDIYNLAKKLLRLRLVER